MNSRCIHCRAIFSDTNSEPVDRISLDFGSLDSNSDAESDSEQEGNISILDALTSIFPGNPLLLRRLDLGNENGNDPDNTESLPKIKDEPKETDIEDKLLMCFSCATKLSTLYESYFQFLYSSQPNSELSDWIKQIQIWHLVTSEVDTLSTSSKNNALLDLILAYILALKNDENQRIDVDTSVKTEIDVEQEDQSYRSSNYLFYSQSQQIDTEYPQPQPETSTAAESDMQNLFSETDARRRSLRKLAPVISAEKLTTPMKRTKKRSLRGGTTKSKNKTPNRARQSKISDNEQHVLKLNVEEQEPQEIPDLPSKDKEELLSDNEADVDWRPELVSKKKQRNTSMVNHRTRSREMAPRKAKEKRQSVKPESGQALDLVKCFVENCSYKYPSSKTSRFKNHLRTKHKDIPNTSKASTQQRGDLVKCIVENCSFMYPKKSKHSYHYHFKHQHKNIPENPDQIFYCPNAGCEAKYIGQIRLLNHIKREHGEESWKRKAPVTCPDCGKVYTKLSYWSHKKEHRLGPSSFCCEICGKIFKRMASLTTHRGIHSAVRKYQCPICKVGYKRSHHLKVHYKTDAHPRELVEELLKQKIRPNANPDVLGPVVCPKRNTFKNHHLWARGRKRSERKGSLEVPQAQSSSTDALVLENS